MTPRPAPLYSSHRETFETFGCDLVDLVAQKHLAAKYLAATPQTTSQNIWLQPLQHPLQSLTLVALALTLLALTLASTSTSAFAKYRVAVIDLKVAKELKAKKTKAKDKISPYEVNALTEELRSVAVNLGAYSVMTKDNMMTLLPPGTKLEDCIGVCEVETGRKLSAHYIITGEIGIVDGRFDLLLRLYETKGGMTISSKSVNAKSITRLRERLKTVAPKLFDNIARRRMNAFGKIDSKLYLTVKATPPTKKLKIKVILDGDYIDVYSESIKQDDGGFLIPIKPDIKHTLEVKADGYISAIEQILVSESAIGNLNLTLSPNVKKETACERDDINCMVELFIHTTPAGAIIYIDGQIYVQDGQEKRTEMLPDDPEQGEVGVRLMPGEHVIEARLPKHLSASRRITLKRGAFNKDMETAPIILTPNYGRLKIITTPPESIIHVDGEMLEKPIQPGVYILDEMEIGAHQVKVMAPDHRQKSEVVFVKRKNPDKRIDLIPAYSHLTLQLKEPTGEAISNVRLTFNIDKSLTHASTQTTDTRGQARFRKIPAGEHKLQASHPLFKSKAITVTSREGGLDQVIPVELTPRYGYLSLRLTGDLEGSVYTKKGKKIGETPLARVKIPVGRHMLRIQPSAGDQYQPVEKRVTLKVKEDFELPPITLPPREGRLTIKTKPTRAEVYINDRRAGRAPMRTTLIQGTYKVEVRLKDYDSMSREVKVVEDKSETLTLNLGENPSVKVSCDPPESVVWVNGLPRGRSPYTHTQRAGSWTLSCRLGDAMVSKTINTQDGDMLKERLEISKAVITAVSQKGKRMKTWGWSLIGVGAVALGAGAGIWLSPVQSATENRARAYQSYLVAPPEQARDRQTLLISTDEELQMWSQTSLISAITGAVLTSAGGLLLAIAPDAKGQARERSKRKKAKRKTPKRKKLKRKRLKRPSATITPLLRFNHHAPSVLLR